MKQEESKNSIIEGKAWCSHHKRWEHVSQFNRNKRNKNGLQKYCKLVSNADNKRNNPLRKSRYKRDYWTIYTLPSGYIGISQQPLRRMDGHRARGRDTNGWRVLMTAPTKEWAKHYEALYQSKSSYYKRKPDYPKWLLPPIGEE